MLVNRGKCAYPKTRSSSSGEMIFHYHSTGLERRKLDGSPYLFPIRVSRFRSRKHQRISLQKHDHLSAFRRALLNRIQNNGTLEITSFSPLSPKSIHFPLFLSRYLPLLVPGSVNLEYVVYSDCRRPVSVSLICLRNTCIHGVTKLHDREKGRKKRRIAEGWRRRSVCSSREEILARTISTRLTKLAKYLGAFSSSRFLFPFAYFCVQSSTLAPLLTSSLSFVLSVFLPIVLVFLLVCVCAFFFVCRCFARNTPIAYVRLESFQFLLLWGYPRLN